MVAKAGAGVEVTGFGGTGAAKAESKHFYVRDKTPGILEVRPSQKAALVFMFANDCTRANDARLHGTGPQYVDL